MGAVLFYHLTQDSVGATLAMLLPKALAAGLRVEIRGTDMEALDRLDQQLWLRPEESFLPHGIAGGPHDARQPILLTCAEQAAPQTRCVMSVDGAVLSVEEAGLLDRSCILFDGGDPAAVEHARGQWRLLTGQGCQAQYWSQEGGRWEKKADSAAG